MSDAKPRPPAAYDADVVMGFINSLLIRNDAGSPTHLNGIKLESSQRQTIERWEKAELVSLSRVDAFLMKFDLMTFEVEHWGLVNLGRDGFHPSGPSPTTSRVGRTRPHINRRKALTPAAN